MKIKFCRKLCKSFEVENNIYMKLLKQRTFEWWEVSMIKVCLISLGIILGLYFYKYLVGLLWLWWTLFAIPALYFIAKFFREK